MESWGFAAQLLTPELAARLGIDEAGVVVMRVARGGAADRGGLRAGDVIVEANRRPVAGIEDLAAALAPADRPALLAVRRGPGTVFVLIERAGG